MITHGNYCKTTMRKKNLQLSLSVGLYPANTITLRVEWLVVPFCRKSHGGALVLTWQSESWQRRSMKVLSTNFPAETRVVFFCFLCLKNSKKRVEAWIFAESRWEAITDNFWERDDPRNWFVSKTKLLVKLRLSRVDAFLLKPVCCAF